MGTLSLQWTTQDTGQAVVHPLPEGITVRIGRAPANGWSVSGDMSISREHLDVSQLGNLVHLRCLETARNSIQFRGDLVREADLSPGETFQIGSTVFQVIGSDTAIPVASRQPTLPTRSPGPAVSDDSHQSFIEQTYRRGELKESKFNAAQQQIEILASLPEVITATQTDEELALTVAQLLLDGIPQAQAVAVVQYDPGHLSWEPTSGAEAPSPALLKVQTREDFHDRFRPSRRLLLKSLKTQESVLHLWKGDASLEFTMTDGLGWAFASPVRGEGCTGWSLYVSGKGARTSKTFFTKEDLNGDLRFTELLTEFIASIRQVRVLQTQRTQLSAFFSPRIIENLTSSQGRASLTPAERDITVIFCVLTGSSHKAGPDKRDLKALLRSVSEALGVLADGILGVDGAIADFQGDAVLGFWGWPLPHAEGALPACQAALRIDAEFRRANAGSESTLAGLQCSIGIAHGRALAGKIGTDQQAKIGVFGPVVNQGSRLVGMARQFQVSIVIDEASANAVRGNPALTDARLRSLARVRPKGMETPMNVFALLPPEDKLPQITSTMLATHEKVVQSIIAGSWTEALPLLAELPETDGPARFLRTFVDQSGGEPPDNWDGTIRLQSK